MSAEQAHSHPTGWWGAVLTGGRSTRMGTDKALVVLDGRTMAERVVGLVAMAGAEQVACIGGDAAALGALGLTVVDDPHQGDGPVAGIRVALAWAGGSGADVVAVVAADLPWLQPETVGRCVEQARVAHCPAVVRTASGLEPLVGAWPTVVASGVEQAWADGHRSVRDVLEAVGFVTVGVDDAAQLANLNRPEQLAWRPDR